MLCTEHLMTNWVVASFDPDEVDRIYMHGRDFLLHFEISGAHRKATHMAGRYCRRVGCGYFDVRWHPPYPRARLFEPYAEDDLSWIDLELT